MTPDSTELSRDPSLARRRMLFGGVAAAAAAGGIGYSWLKAADSDASSLLWTQNFDTPAGSSLALVDLRGKPLLINFWATWCPPCVEELPLLDRFYKENSAKNWQVVGLAIDQPTAVRNFLGKTPVSFPVGLAGLGGTELGKSLGNLTGGLPFTIVLDAKGAVVQRKMGKLSEADLKAWTQIT